MEEKEEMFLFFLSPVKHAHVNPLNIPMSFKGFEGHLNGFSPTSLWHFHVFSVANSYVIQWNISYLHHCNAPTSVGSISTYFRRPTEHVV